MTRGDARRRLSREIILPNLWTIFPGDWTPQQDGCTTAELAEGRYAAVAKSTTEPGRYWVSTRNDHAEAMALHRDDPEHWAPFAVLDLDTLEWSVA